MQRKKEGETDYIVRVKVRTTVNWTKGRIKAAIQARLDGAPMHALVSDSIVALEAQGVDKE